MADQIWTSIQGALDLKLSQIITDIQIVFENQQDPTGVPVQADSVHIEPFFIPGETVNIEVFENGKQRAVGIYRIIVRTPLLQGKYEMNQLCGRLIAGFSKGLVLSLGNVNVRIVKAYPSGAFVTGRFYQTSVTVNWLTDI